MKLLVRDAGAADVEVLRDIYRRASLSNDGDAPNLLAHPEALVWSVTALVEGRVRVAEHEGRVVGFATTVDGAGVAELDDLFVEPESMRRGVARELILDAASTARLRGARRIEVTANDHALDFYLNVGFVRDGVIETQFGPGIRMHLDVGPTASQLAHEGLLVHNPLPLTAIDAGIDRLDLAPGARVLDVGSGTGELLRRIVERWPGVTGVGIDLLEAPPIHLGVELRTGDAASIETERFDVVCCIGSIHALGGFPDGYARLAALAPTVLLGDGYWRRDPDPEYLHALDATVDEMPMRDGLESALADAGLRVRWSAEAEVADLTAYEEALLTAADLHPERADAMEYAAAIRRWRAAPGGTDTLGFALFLLKRV